MLGQLISMLLAQTVLLAIAGCQTPDQPGPEAREPAGAVPPLGAEVPERPKDLTPAETEEIIEAIDDSEAAAEEVPNQPTSRDNPFKVIDTPEGLDEVKATLEAQPVDAELEAFLERIDAADRRTDSFRATIWHITESFIDLDVQIRTGTLTLRTDWVASADHPKGLPLRQFRVDFEKLILGDRQSDYRRSYIFDGEWLAERIDDEKVFNKWQIVPPGERFDPMDRLQGSKVWMPVGQDVKRLRERFEPSLVDAGDYFFDKELNELVEMNDTLRGTIDQSPGLAQLRLVPHVKDDFVELRIWFDPETDLPVAHAVYEGKDNGVQTSILYSPESNMQEIDAGRFNTTTMPATDGWSGTIQPWRGRADD